MDKDETIRVCENAIVGLLEMTIDDNELTTKEIIELLDKIRKDYEKKL